MTDQINTDTVRIREQDVKIGIPSVSLGRDELNREFDNSRFRVAIFGSARTKVEDQDYQDVFRLAQMIADADIDLVNGGGPGIMEAASLGHNAGHDLGRDVRTIGLNIQLPFEQEPNKYLDYSVTDETFSRRLDQFVLLSHVFVVAPGGIGTCLELFYVWQLMQVNHICRMPIVLLGSMWQDLLKWVETSLLKEGLISPEDIYPVVCVDTPEQAMAVIQVAHESFEKAGKNACVNITKYKAALKQLGL